MAADSVAIPEVELRDGDEELWIIARGASPERSLRAMSLPGMARAKAMYIDRALVATTTVVRDSDRDSDRDNDMDPGSGAMVANLPVEGARGAPGQVPLPLQHTAVDASVAGHVGTVNVRQRFENPFDTKIEAVYLFPLPERAAVSEFLMVIGDRTIRGIVREKEEAEAIYRHARAQGYRASLLVQRRPNIFEQKVANIEPGRAIDVDITYFHTLSYRDGWYSFVFPMVVGPRYNPPGHADPIAAVPRGGGAANPGGTAVQYLSPDERSGHDIGIRVRIDAGVTIEEIKSSHEIAATRERPESASVTLAQGTAIPNRDFVLDFRVAGRTVKSNLLTHTNPETGEGFFTLMLIPPAGHHGRRAPADGDGGSSSTARGRWTAARWSRRRRRWPPPSRDSNPATPFRSSASPTAPPDSAVNRYRLRSRTWRQRAGTCRSLTATEARR